MNKIPRNLTIALYYVGGCLLWLVAIAFAPLEQSAFGEVFSKLVVFSLAFVLGFAFKETFNKRPWLALFIPLVLIALEVFGLF